MLENKILILADERIGTYSQAVALAKEAGLDYEIVFLEYNFLKIIPNLFFSRSLIRLKKTSIKKLQALNYIPKYIISAGRKSAPIAIFLKKNHNFLPKIIQIMRPEINFNKFDFVIVPEHDEPKSPYPQNLILSVGALTKIEKNFEQKNHQEFLNQLKNFPKPIITLLIGGSSKKTKFSLKSAEELINQALLIQKKMNGTLIIANSRRTDFEINNFIKKITEKNCIFFDYNEVKNNNPFNLILNFSDFFIISGDSVSMISECCSTGKSVFIFDDGIISSKKHQKFHKILVEKNYAKFFVKKYHELNDFNPPKLEEVKRICKLIF
jgi:mitochondrial fission protein ELM1